MQPYNYVIIKYNNKTFKRESTLLENKYKKSKKYVFIIKMINRDSSESIASIQYSNDLEDLQQKANGFVSWYNYPMNLYKNIQGFISELS